MLTHLLDYSETEINFIDPKKYTESYEKLKEIVADLEKLELDENLYLQTRINLLTHAYNHVFNIKDANKKLLKTLYNQTFELLYTSI